MRSPAAYYCDSNTSLYGKLRICIIEEFYLNYALELIYYYVKIIFYAKFYLYSDRW